ncbi:MAG: DUF2232 domain-containing protein [Beijerinckiaceae bacterium]|nr:DUF2232 domain-containing protein [Beijerinckiaceae bacterium]
MQILLLAGLAGFASALLSGMLTPGMVSLAFLFLVAPLPLFIVGFGWHALVSALAGLIGAILIDLASGDRAALAFVSLFALPAFLIPAAAERSFAAFDRDIRRDGIITGQIALATTGYLAMVIVMTSVWIEPDYAQFVSRMRGFVTEGLRQMAGPNNPALNDPATLNRIVELMSAIILPVSGLLIVITLVASAALGAMLAEKSGRMSYVKPALSMFRLPGGSLILFAATLLVAMWDGYTGVFAEILAFGLAVLLVLQGLAVLHARLAGKNGRGLLLTAAWGSIVFFGFPALVFLGVGAADHLLDLRNRKRAGG